MFGDVTDPAYWVRQVRDTVRFADGVDALRDNGVTTFVELGPDPVLSAHVDGSVAVLRRDRDEAATLLTAVATAWTRGTSRSTGRELVPGRRVDAADLPVPRHRYWLDHAPRRDRPGRRPATRCSARRSSLASGDGVVLTGRLSVAAQPWLAEHVVLGRILLPGTAFVELAARGGAGRLRPVDELTLQAPLRAARARRRPASRSASTADGAGARSYSRPDADARALDPARHGVLAGELRHRPPRCRWPAGRATGRPGRLLRRARRAGLAYGPTFQGLPVRRRDGDEVFAEVALPDPAQAGEFGLHPALLDAALHALMVSGLVSRRRAAAVRLVRRDLARHRRGCAAGPADRDRAGHGGVDGVRRSGRARRCRSTRWCCARSPTGS